MATWQNKYSDRPKEGQERILDYMSTCNFVAPTFRFQKIIRIPLNKLREDIPSFIVPRMYYYLNGTNLLKYLEKELIPDGDMLYHSFDVIEDDDIC